MKIKKLKNYNYLHIFTGGQGKSLGQYSNVQISVNTLDGYNFLTCIDRTIWRQLWKVKRLRNNVLFHAKHLTFYMYRRVEWFWEEKNCYTLYVLRNCCWTPIPKLHVLMLPLSLVARPLKIWAVTLKSAKEFLFKPFWSFRQGGTYSLIF